MAKIRGTRPLLSGSISLSLSRSLLADVKSAGDEWKGEKLSEKYRVKRLGKKNSSIELRYTIHI